MKLSREQSTKKAERLKIKTKNNSKDKIKNLVNISCQIGINCLKHVSFGNASYSCVSKLLFAFKILLPKVFETC